MKDGSKFLLEGKDLSIVLKTPYGKQEILDYSVNGNVIEWTFLGKDQKFLGKYSLILVVNKNSEGMVTTDACNFVELVACSCEANGADDAGVQTESIDLVSNVEIGGGSSYDDSELRKAIEDLDNRVAAHSEDIVNLQENKADKSELTELSAEVGKKVDADFVNNAIATAITNELNATFSYVEE